MSAERPRTTAEWRAYLDTLSGDELWDKAKAANDGVFIQSLIQEGYTSLQIEAVFVLVAHRFKALKQRPPLDGWFELASLTDQPLPK